MTAVDSFTLPEQSTPEMSEFIKPTLTVGERVAVMYDGEAVGSIYKGEVLAVAAELAIKVTHHDVFIKEKNKWYQPLARTTLLLPMEDTTHKVTRLED